MGRLLQVPGFPHDPVVFKKKKKEAHHGRSDEKAEDPPGGKTAHNAHEDHEEVDLPSPGNEKRLQDPADGPDHENAPSKQDEAAGPVRNRQQVCRSGKPDKGGPEEGLREARGRKETG